MLLLDWGSQLCLLMGIEEPDGFRFCKFPRQPVALPRLGLLLAGVGGGGEGGAETWRRERYSEQGAPERGPNHLESRPA